MNLISIKRLPLCRNVPIFLNCTYLFFKLPAPAPQVGDSCPFKHVHMFGREQNPSPHEFRQIAAKNIYICIYQYTNKGKITNNFEIIVTQ